MAPDKESEAEGGEERVSCFKSPKFAIYFNYILSSWGDRMWHFAVGLYLVNFDDGVLLLAAIYGFTCGGAILLFGGLIGQWVDCNQRLIVVRVSLFIQNLCVMGSALVVCVILYMEDRVDTIWGGKLSYFLNATVMVLAIIAQLASVAYKISIEKDWIVIIAAGDSSKLANLNAVTRSMDLLCQVLAPTAVGQVMTFGSLLLSAIFIAVWNLVSVFVEYALLSRVYRLVPRLHYKELANGTPVRQKKQNDNEEEMKEMLNGKVVRDAHEGTPEDYNLLREAQESEQDNPQSKESDGPQTTQAKRSCLRLLFQPCVMLFEGWRTYARQKVVYAGISLAFLYMTVLGFDSITIGYMYAQGVTAAVLGAATAVAGLMGITGTFLFTRTRKRLGLECTGVIAFATEIAFLTLAVGSIWAPGSPFDLEKSYGRTCNQTISNSPIGLIDAENSSVNLLHRHPRAAPVYDMMGGYLNERGDDFSLLPLPTFALNSPEASSESWPNTFYTRNRRDISNMTSSNASTHNVSSNEIVCDNKAGLTVSVIIFLVGIVLSRIGLWMADLSVNQLLQEFVIEGERGVVNGVQNSMNMLMDVIKFTMVILAPHIQTFGILIILSFSFIVLGGLCFVFHVYFTGCGRTLRLAVEAEDLEMKVKV